MKAVPAHGAEYDTGIRMKKFAATLATMAAFAMLAIGQSACAQDPGKGPFGIDRRIAFDNRGIWSHSVQQGLQGGLVIGAVATALYEGSESRLGKTAWQSIDSIVLTAGATTASKAAFSRMRPSQTDDPGKFFQGPATAARTGVWISFGRQPVTDTADVLYQGGSELLAQCVDVNLDDVAADLLAPSVELVLQLRA